MYVPESSGYRKNRTKSGDMNATKSRGVKAAGGGFTLIEMLVVIAIITILLLALFPAMNAAFRNARRGRASHEIASLVAAIKSYHSEYGKWPCPNNGTDDQTFHAASGNPSSADAQAQVINCLTNNPERHVFLDVPARSMVNGFYVDPWGNPYVIVLDTDFNNNCRVSSGSAGEFNNTNILNKSICVWSWGEPGGGIRAAITSW